MNMDKFKDCLALVLHHEGGYVDHPKDPGGATKYGITNGTYQGWLRANGKTPHHVKYITDDEVGAIYRQTYWNVIKGDDLPAGIDYAVFDAAVNSGTNRGAKWMQKALGTVPDGIVGPSTIFAANALDPEERVEVIKKAIATRLGFLKGLSIWGTFGRGWARRVAEVEASSIAMVANYQALRAEAEESKAKIKHELSGVASTGVGGGALSLTNLPSGVIYAGLFLVVVLAFVTFKRYTAEKDREIAMSRMAEAMEQEEKAT